MKADCQRKGDTNHSLRLEIKDKDKELKAIKEELKKDNEDASFLK